MITRLIIPNFRDLILLVLVLCANMAIGVLDLQYIHMCMVLCKRFRTLNKIIQHIVKPFRTFRSEVGYKTIFFL